MKVFMELIQAKAELWKHPLIAKTPKTYLRKPHIDCYYFCWQYEDHFEILDAIGMNYISFAAL